MFKNEWPRRILSNNDFEVQIGSRGALIYREGEKILNVNSEYLAGGKGIAIYKSSIRKWNPPFENELIDNDKQNKILKNIKEALAFKKIDVQTD